MPLLMFPHQPFDEISVAARDLHFTHHTPQTRKSRPVLFDLGGPAVLSYFCQTANNGLYHAPGCSYTAGA